MKVMTSLDQRTASIRGALIEGGISADLRSALGAVVEATVPVPGQAESAARFDPAIGRKLRRAIATRTYGRDLLDVCMLVRAADWVGRGGSGYVGVLFGRVANSSTLGPLFAAADWRRSGCEATRHGVVVRLNDGLRSIAYPRMPYLLALLDFVIEAVGWAEVEPTLAPLTRRSLSLRNVQDVANVIAQALTAYLAGRLDSSHAKRKFQELVDYLARQAKSAEDVRDSDVLEFWVESAGRGHHFRLYRSVLEAFVNFLMALDAARDIGAAEAALPIGPRADRGEVDPGTIERGLEAVGLWRSPEPDLDEEPAARIKFLTDAERAVIATIADYGPYGERLPVSLLREATLGAWQRRVVQASRDADHSRTVIDLGPGEDYPSRLARQHQVAHLLDRAIRAAAFVTLRDHPDAVGTPQLATAKRDFASMTRAGFRDADLADPEVVAGFREGALVLMRIAERLRRYHIALARALPAARMSERFSTDQATFAAVLGRLYGDAA
jgi:hypothetical protein